MPTSSRSRARTRSRFAPTATPPTPSRTPPTSWRTCTDEQLRAIPGIGKDLASKIREIAETGEARYHRDLLEQFPPTILDLLHLQGVGPKTVALLYSQLGIKTLDELEAACSDGRVRRLKGLGPKKEQLILKACAERKQHTGRHLLPDAAEAARLLLDYLRAECPDGRRSTVVGSLRRGAETSGDIDILATGADPHVMSTFTMYKLVERILGQGETKSSVLLWGGIQADLRLVPSESQGAAMQYFTGSKSHNIALRDRAIARGFKLNEYGLFRVDDGCGSQDEPKPTSTRRSAWTRSRPSFARGAARSRLPNAARSPPRPARRHPRRYSRAHDRDRRPRRHRDDGARRQRRGLHLPGDHRSQQGAGDGQRPRRASRARCTPRRIREIGARLDGITLLAGIECDIRPDGTMDLADDCLAQLDVVVASVHSAFNQDEAQMTDRMLRAIACPYVDIIGHPTGRLLLRREPYKVNVRRIIDAAAAAGVALEINCQIDRLDLSDVNARAARERGVGLVISTDSHSESGFRLMKWGVQVARRAWLTQARCAEYADRRGVQSCAEENRT